MKLPLPSRIPILYLIISVLIAVGVVPLYFYATKVVDMNRETLQRNEKLLQNTVTSSLAQEIAQREKDSFCPRQPDLFNPGNQWRQFGR